MNPNLIAVIAIIFYGIIPLIILFYLLRQAWPVVITIWRELSPTVMTSLEPHMRNIGFRQSNQVARTSAVLVPVVMGAGIIPVGQIVQILSEVSSYVRDIGDEKKRYKAFRLADRALTDAASYGGHDALSGYCAMRMYRTFNALRKLDKLDTSILFSLEGSQRLAELYEQVVSSLKNGNRSQLFIVLVNLDLLAHLRTQYRPWEPKSRLEATDQLFLADFRTLGRCIVTDDFEFQRKLLKWQHANRHFDASPEFMLPCWHIAHRMGNPRRAKPLVPENERIELYRERKRIQILTSNICDVLEERNYPRVFDLLMADIMHSEPWNPPKSSPQVHSHSGNVLTQAKSMESYSI